MTAPIQEPSTDRALQGVAYARDQIFRRPAPTGTSALPYCWMRWAGSDAVTVDTLTNPATAFFPYEESFIYDPKGLASFNPDMSSGCVEWSEPGEYLVWAAVAWRGGAAVGTTLAGVLDRGNDCTFSSNRLTNMIVADAINEEMLIPLTNVLFYPDFGINSVRVLVYHNDAGGMDLGQVDIHVIQLNPNVDGEFFT